MRRIFKVDELSESSDYTALVNLLTTYQRQGENRRWDDFRYKIPPELLVIFGNICKECLRNGFTGPRIENGNLVFYQMYGDVWEINDVRNGDLCTFCERDCIRREMIDSGSLKFARSRNPEFSEPKTCWE